MQSYASVLKKNFTSAPQYLDGDYKKKNPLNKRKKESETYRTKYPDRIPVICELARNTQPDNVFLTHNQLFVPKDLTIGQLTYVIRQKIKTEHGITLQPTKAIFIFINNFLPPAGQTLEQIYENNKDPYDNLLYVVISFENTFG